MGDQRQGLKGVIQNLAVLGDVATLLDQFEDSESEEVLLELAGFLGLHADGCLAFEGLRRLAKRPVLPVGLGALDALAQARPEDTQDLFLEIMRGEGYPEDLRVRAISHCSPVVPEIKIQLSMLLRHRSDRIARAALDRVLTAGPDAAYGTLNGDVSRVRMQAIEDLVGAVLRLPCPYPQAEELAEHHDEAVRFGVARSLPMDDPRGVAIARKLSDDPSPVVRREAVATLQQAEDSL